MNAVQIGKWLVGPGQPCLLAAEIGINHNGDLDLAHRMIDAAADAGADAVKFQNYRTEDFLSDRSLTHEYTTQGRKVIEPQFDMFKRYELPSEWLIKLKEKCDRRGIIFFSTPTSQEGIDDLVRVGTLLLKNGSDYLTNLPVIRSMARSGLPTVLSTGMATLAEIDEAVRTFREAGGQQLILLQCTSSYPTPFTDVHLSKIRVLRAAFDCPVGLSDHTEGIIAGVGAVALGACMLEKHFTLDKTLPGPDHSFSADPQEFRQLATSVRALEQCLGESTIRPANSEAQARRDYRLSCVTVRSMPANHCIREEDITFRRPGTGFPPALITWLIGNKLRNPLPAGHILQIDDLMS